MHFFSRLSFVLIATAMMSLAGCASAQSSTDSTVAMRGMVATVHPLATDAGVTAMKRGGNAVDAAVAAALTLGVVDGFNSGIGGGCFILIRTADGKFAAIDGREMAPAAAHADMYVRDGVVQSEWSKSGPLASGVPGALAAYDHAIKTHGKLKLADLLRPAADIADRGFILDANFAGRLSRTAATLRRYEGSRAALLKADGSPYAEGERLRQPDLARTYRAIADGGKDWFYRGEFAQRVGAWMANHGGMITAADFANYHIVQRQPLVTTYRGYTVVGFPPPSSGGTHVAQILNMLERFDLKAIHQRDPAEFVHITAEAMKLAFADRAYWLGDPDFAEVPRGLIDKKYAAQLASRIDANRVTAVKEHGRPPQWQREHFGRHTTHIAAADAAGNWVAITATINTTFGSKVVVPGTGVVLNNEMDDFSIQPGVPNAFGLIGAEANRIEPGKRPLSSMSPTIVLKNGRPVMTVGAAGGPKIITEVLLAIVNHLDLGMALRDAVGAPRFHHQWSPDELVLENTMDDAIAAALEQRGHKIEQSAGSGVTQAITIGPNGRGFIGVHDPRVGGKAMGF